MPQNVPDLVAYLRSLDAVRDRSQKVFDLVVSGKADHWDWHEENLDKVVEYCLNIIQVRLYWYTQLKPRETLAQTTTR